MENRKKIKNLIFMGTPDFAAAILERLIASGNVPQAVFTQPDRPKGRSGKPQMSPVKELALSHGIMVYQPEKIRNPENVGIIQKIDPDVIVVAAFGQIIPESILKIPAFGCINVHASLLPAWRGAAPIQWSILNGDTMTGVTTMRMDKGLDTGDMIEKIEVPIEAKETGGSLFDKLSRTGGEIILSTLKLLEEGNAVFTPQPAQSPTPYASMLKRQMGEIDWTRSAVSIERMIRALNPWPSAFTSVNGRQLKIWKAEVLDEKPDAPAGTILKCSGDLLMVAAGEGVLKIDELQLEGKKRMDTASFLRGYHLDEKVILPGGDAG